MCFYFYLNSDTISQTQDKDSAFQQSETKSVFCNTSPYSTYLKVYGHKETPSEIEFLDSLLSCYKVEKCITSSLIVTLCKKSGGFFCVEKEHISKLRTVAKIIYSLHFT